MKALRIATVLLIMGLLASCGGGGGGGVGGGGVVRPTTFTSSSNVTPGQKVQANGLSQTINVTLDPITGAVTAKTINPTDSNNSNVVLSHASSAPLTLIGIDVNTPTSSASWLNGRSGEMVRCSAGICAALNAPAASATSGGFALDPFAMGWDYQTFGSWQTVLPITSGAGGASRLEA